MYNNLSDAKRIEIYVDEQKNMVVFPISKVSKKIDFDEGDEYFTSKEFFEMKSPYSIECVADAIEQCIKLYGKCEPYDDKKVTIEEFYYGIKGFNNATRGKKLLSVGWDDIGGKEVSVSLPAKNGKYYITLERILLPNEANWIEFAEVVVKLINMNLNEYSGFKTYKSKLNI